jgi:energy-coupling factor transporter ATP-binding protein EcfA2
MEDVMLHIKIHRSVLRSQLRWKVDVSLGAGVCHRLAAPNGSGKTSFLEELKLQWPDLFPTHLLGFCDQASLAPFQDLTVEAMMDVLWDVVPQRRIGSGWRQLPWWQASDVRHWWARKVSQLSGGENQWVKILMMRTIVSDVWLLDEPFQSLDQNRQSELWGLLGEWLAAGKYLVLVHHGEVELRPLRTWTLACAEQGLSLEARP